MNVSDHGSLTHDASEIATGAAQGLSAFKRRAGLLKPMAPEELTTHMLKTYRSLDEAISYVNGRPRPLALYYFGTDTGKRDDVLRRTISGGATVNGTLFHFAAENLPFGGIGPSGIGAYHGEFGFQTFSHRKGVFLQSRLSGTRFLYPPFGRLTDLMLKVLNRGGALATRIEKRAVETYQERAQNDDI